VTAAIVVAGGRSRRFGSEKLRHSIGGSSLLERTLRAASVCRPVVVVTASDLVDEVVAERALPESVDVITVSEYPRWGGPCAALAAGLDTLEGRDEDVIVLPADLSDPDDAVTALLDIREGVLTDDDGWPQWLVARAPLPVLQDRVARLRSRSGGLDDLPASAVMSIVATRAIAPERAVRDIDTPADLEGTGRPSEEATRGTR
jgi:molybdopterin-guanine dinucleotide biosynthesis protein A